MTVHGRVPALAERAGAGPPDPRFDHFPRSGDPVGWYLDPADPQSRRLWDGAGWASDGAGGPLRRQREPSEPLPRSLDRTLVLGSVLPFLGALLLPVPVMALTQPSGGAGPVEAWLRSLTAGSLVGIGLWILALTVWQRVWRTEAEQLTRSYVGARRWNRTLVALVILTGIVGCLGLLLSFFALALAMAFSSMNAGL